MPSEETPPLVWADYLRGRGGWPDGAQYRRAVILELPVTSPPNSLRILAIRYEGTAFAGAAGGLLWNSPRSRTSD